MWLAKRIVAPTPAAERLQDFKYESLDEIKNEFRLLSFEESYDYLSDGLVRLQIKHFSLDNCPEYHALSYVWGSSSKTWPIILNGASMNVTHSLGTSLERFQSDDTIKWLWVDALCINQTDDEEKSSQVQKMRHIYNRAHRVLSWLGLPASGTEELMANIESHGMRLLDYGWRKHREVQDRAWGNIPHRTPTHPNQLVTSHPAQWQAFESLAGLLKSSPTFFAETTSELSLSPGTTGPFPLGDMLDFLRRPNWCRVWILQEFAVAKDLYLVCGNTKLKYTYFFVVYYIYNLYYEDQTHGTIITEPSGSIASVIASLNPVYTQTLLVMRYKTSSELQFLLNSAFRLGATNPADRVFALLGLAEDSVSLGIIPDYKKSYGEVCVDTAWKLLSKHGLTILNESRGVRESKYAHDLPSWVPDWSMRTRTTLTGKRLPLFFEDAEFCASGDSVMSLETQSGTLDMRLQIGGSITTETSAVGSAADFSVPRVSSSNLCKAKTFLAELQQLARKFSDSRPYVGENGWEQDVFQIPIAHRKIEAISPSDRVLYDAKSAQMHEAYDLISRFGGNQAEEENLWRAQNCHDYVTYMCRMADVKVPFACYGDAEYLGMGPKEMEPGDRLVMLFGANVPFVLRPFQSGRYKLVGEAYVSGLMHGEVFSTNVVAEMFVLE
jgi:hypothetical protein